MSNKIHSRTIHRLLNALSSSVQIVCALCFITTLAFNLAAQTPTPTPTPTQQERGLKLGQPTPTPANVSAATNAALEKEKPELVLQTGHAMRVDGLAFSPDGRLLASGSADHTVKLWDTASERELRNLAGHTAWVKAVAFSADGKWLVSGSVDGNVRVWDVLTGREVRSWTGGGSINAIALSPDARIIVTGNGENVVKLWDAQTGNELRVLAGHTGGVLCVVFSPDGKVLASGGRDNTIKLWDAASGRELHTLTGHTGSVRALDFSADGRRLASGSSDRTVKIWDVSKGRETRTLTGHTGSVLSVAFSTDGQRLFSGASDKRTIKIWDAGSGRELQTVNDPSSLDTLEAIAFSADGKFVATSNGDKTISLRATDGRSAERVLATRSSGVYSTAFSPNGKWFASGSKDNTIRLWEVATGRQLFALEANTGWITALVFSPDNHLLASGGLSGGIKLWDVETGQEVRRLDGHGESINALAFNADGRLASASNDKTIKIWDVSATHEIATLSGHTDEVQSIAFSKDGHWLVSASADKTVKIWETATNQEVKTLSGHQAGVYGVAFSPDGKLIASASYDQTVKLWDLASGRETQTIRGASGFSTVSFSPDGRWLIAGNLTGAIKVWNVSAAHEAHELNGHTGAIDGLAFSADGRWFSTASEDGSTRLWETETGDFLAALVSLQESNQWLVVAPDGLFDGSPEAWNQILWRFGQNTFNAKPVEVFFNEYYYPGLLGDILAGKRPKAARDIALRDRRQPQVRLSLADAQANPADINARNVALKIEVEEAPSDQNYAQGSGAQDVRLFRNGALVQVWHGDVLNGGGGKKIIETTVPIVAGDNQLTAYAFNRDNVKSANAELALKGDASLKRAGTAYILAIGLNQYANPRFNLKYAIADAQVFGEEVERAQAKVDSFAHIEVIPLLNREGTKANILLALRRLSGDESPLPADAPEALAKLKRALPEDTVIVYYAGHGLAQQQRFYLIPHDLGYQGERSDVDAASLRTLLSHSISDQELEAAFEGIDAAQLLLVLDACNSGQALEAEEKRRGPMNSKGLAQLAYEKGMFVLTAAQSYQAAQEVARFGHGLLTYALVVQGLKEGAADTRPKDGQVVMGEWLDYATTRVPQMQLETLRKSRGLLNELAFVEGEQRIINPENRSLQRPRVFYRRELAARPLVVTKLGATQAQTGN